MTGFVNVLKIPHISSALAVAQAKKALGINDIGHLGTLDPLASGVLPMAVGRATKLFNLMLGEDKEYLAVFRFGIETNSYDLDSAITKTCGKKISLEDFSQEAKKFIGTFEQIPPLFSAKKIGGKRAYDFARSGKEVALSGKTVTIYNISQIEQCGDNEFSLHIKCSSGTYIRSLVRDIASNLGTVGVLSALLRTRQGNFKIENAKIPLDIKKEDILPVDSQFDNYKKVYIAPSKRKHVVNGLPFESACELNDGEMCLVYCDSEFLGIGIRHNENTIKLKIHLYEL